MGDITQKGEIAIIEDLTAKAIRYLIDGKNESALYDLSHYFNSKMSDFNWVTLFCDLYSLEHKYV